LIRPQTCLELKGLVVVVDKAPKLGTNFNTIIFAYES
jgi:hypothetical protein